MADKIAAQGPGRRLARRAGLAGHGRRLGDGQRRRTAQKFVAGREEGLPHRQDAQQARRAQVRRHPHRLGRQPDATGPPIPRATPRRSPRRSAKPPRSPRTTASGSPPKAKSAGPACTPGRTCSTCSNEVGMPETRRLPGRPWPTPISTCSATTPSSTPCSSPATRQAEFDAAYTKMTDALRPWTIDFHVAQNDGTVHGTGSPRQDRPPLPGRRPQRQARHRQDAPATGSKTPRAAASTTSAGTAACSPTRCSKQRNLEHDPRRDDQSPRRPRLELTSQSASPTFA